MRLAFVSFFFITALLGGSLEKKIENFLGKKEYESKKNLIHILFNNRVLFLNKNGSVDDIAVLRKLKENGLLKLFHKTPQKLNIAFLTKSSPIIFVRVIGEALSSMGYNYFLTKRVLRNLDTFVWDIIISTEHIVDPLTLFERLKERGCFFESVQRAGKNRWIYRVNSKNINIDALNLELDETTKLKKPIKPYWINVKNVKTIEIESKRQDHWYPSIILYDKKLHVVKNYEKETITKKVKIDLTEYTRYIKITDMYGLENIKRGMLVYLKKRIAGE